MDLGLKGKRALVTGGSKGIGYSIAELLLTEGAEVAICARDEVGLKEAAQSLASGQRGRIETVQADVAQRDDLDRLVGTTHSLLGGIDILVVNPGHPPTSFERDFGYTDEDWVTGFEQLVLSGVRLARLVVPAMIDAGWGRVVLVSTLLGREPNPNHILSGALRMCSHSFMKSLATEFAPSGITVNCVLPGAIVTPRAREAAALAATKGLEAPALALGIPVGRMGKPEEVAAAVGFLCSAQAAYITGTALPVDGGVLRGI
jgi:3-oxoacyl-[acyl-carrier protein] reductase